MIRINIVATKTKVITFAMMIGKSSLRMPYTSHKKTPVVNTAYMPNDRSLVCLVFMVFIACGRNDAVVHVAAIKPSKVIMSIVKRTAG